MKHYKDFNIKNNNSFGLSCIISHYVEALNFNELQEALLISHKNHLPLIPLGEATNVILPVHWRCVGLKVAIKGIYIIEKKADYVILEVGSGENWHQFIKYCLKQEFYGLENLALIPGSAGATPIQNIGAYGVQIKDFLLSVKALEISSGNIYILSADECELSYRNSKFKNIWRDKFIITAIRLKLYTKPQINISYKSLKDELDGLKNISPLDVYKAVIKIRKSILPNPLIAGNVGSFFHNPTVSKRKFNQIKKSFSKAKGFLLEDGKVRIASAWLIEECGFNGYKKAKVGIAQEHSLCMINLGGAEQKGVIDLANKIKKSVAKKFNILLTIEPRIYL